MKGHWNNVCRGECLSIAEMLERGRRTARFNGLKWLMSSPLQWALLDNTISPVKTNSWMFLLCLVAKIFNALTHHLDSLWTTSHSHCWAHSCTSERLMFLFWLCMKVLLCLTHLTSPFTTTVLPQGTLNPSKSPLDGFNGSLKLGNVFGFIPAKWLLGWSPLYNLRKLSSDDRIWVIAASGRVKADFPGIFLWFGYDFIKVTGDVTEGCQ